MKISPRFSKLRVENLEERTLLAVMAGGPEMVAQSIAPTGSVVWVVNTLEDSTDWTVDDEVVSLREAIERAQTGDTITFDDGLAGGTITLCGSQLEVYQGITIDASAVGGITIDAAGNSRVFYIMVGSAENPVELIDLTITGGDADRYGYGEDRRGGGIYNQSGTLKVTGLTISGNTARDGGGITNYGTLTLINSTVSGNSTSDPGDFGGGGVSNGGYLTMINCTISRNTSEGGDGGGIFNGGSMTTTDCTISNNTATDIHYSASYSGYAGYGGGICNFGMLTMTRCSIIGNSSPIGAGICNGSFTFHNYDSILTMSDCNVSENSTSNYYLSYGGGICNGDPFNSSEFSGSKQIVISNCSVSCNSAQNGGGIYNNPNCTIVITDSSITGNTASQGGAVCCANTGSLTITDCVISGNTATYGGGIRTGVQWHAYDNTQSSSRIVTLTGCVVSSNCAIKGGGLYNDVYRRAVRVDSCVFSENNAGNGAGIYNNSGQLNLANCVVSENSVRGFRFHFSEGGQGCGIYNGNSSLTLTNCTVTENYIVDQPNSGSCSGGIYGSFTSYNSIIALNYVGDQISDISNASREAYNTLTSDPKLRDTEGYIPYCPSIPLFENSENGYYSLAKNSQAIDKGNNKYVTTIIDIAENSRVIGRAVDLGAYEYVERVEKEPETPSIVVTTTADLMDDTDNLISLREAIFYAADGDIITFDSSLAGRSITLDGRELRIDKNLVIDATGIGGIVIDADYKSRIFKIDENDSEIFLDLKGLELVNGCAYYGGAIYNFGTLTIENCSIYGNMTPGDGGGIFNSGNLTIMNSSISGNRAVRFYDTSVVPYYILDVGGGGIRNNWDGILTLTNCIISENRAGRGGGISNSGMLTMTNCTVSRNTANGNGGGIYDDGISTLTNCTIVGNHADTGGGIFNYYGGSMMFYNSIIVLNSAKNEGADVYGWGYAYNTLSSFTDWAESEYCLTYDSSLPLFTDPANGDYALAENSQAIDKGSNTYVATETDLAGNMRIVNGIVDIGAYEYGSSPQVKQLTSPTITTGNRGIFVSYGANRHQITWAAVENASGYELASTTDGVNWSSAWVGGTSGAVVNLTYGNDVTYRVRALGEGLFTDSEWSEGKTFTVCPMDINGDDFIGPGDHAILSTAWFLTEEDANWDEWCDIDGDGFIGPGDYSYLSSNWFLESESADLIYPPAKASDTVFTEFASADLGVDLDVF